ncbi:MAG: amidohydrolase [Planctomycetia bacterium]|nr:amidohydrolase [Planctomycetia bacterium]
MAVGAVARGTLGQLSGGSKVDVARLPYIDAHSHVWSADVEKWPLVKGQTRADLKPLSFTPEELLALAAPEGVGRVVLIQHSGYHLWDNSYLIDCAARYGHPGADHALSGRATPRFSIVAMIDDRADRPGEKLRELLTKGVRGLRITPRIHGEKWLEGPGMESLWKTGAETGQAMCCLIDVQQLARVSEMCRRHPNTPVVIDHFARVGVDGTIRDADIAALCDLARHKRVSVKLSAYYALGKKEPPYEDLLPLIRRVLDAFGVERCMWASDAPYQVQPPHTYAASIGLIRDRMGGLSAGDKEWLLAKTAERVFFA